MDTWRDVGQAFKSMDKVKKRRFGHKTSHFFSIGSYVREKEWSKRASKLSFGDP